MSQPCAITTCKRASRTLCHCCNQNLCRDHFNEHDDLLNSQLNPLADEINVLGDRLAAFNLEKITDDARQKLNQWQADCHKTIDRFYEQKSQELDQYVADKLDRQHRELGDLRTKMTKLIDTQETTRQDIDSFTSTIQNIKQSIESIEQIRIEIDIHPLVIEDRTIQIGKLEKQQCDLSSLSLPCQTIEYRNQISLALAGNERFLLLHMDSYISFVDESLSIIKKKRWNYEDIEDMCWSSTLNCFIVLTGRDVFLVIEESMSIIQVDSIEREKWWACGCSNESLYLSTPDLDSSVSEFTFLPSIQFVKCWKTVDAVEQRQRIDSIVFNHGTLALAINDASIQAKLIQLRSSKTFVLLWSVQLNTEYNSNTIRCCLLNQNEWLVADWCRLRLFHITHNGIVKETCLYNLEPYCMHLFRSNILAILTKGRVNFHEV